MKNIKLFLLVLAVFSAALSCRKDPVQKEDPEPEDPAINLSASATANCYIVSEAGEYKFNAQVKGCSTESVGEPVSAEVLWETFCSKTSPDKGDILTVESEVRKGFVYFKTPEELCDGNAVIAVKNSDGEIIWSWHIWVVKGFAPTKENQQVYNCDAGVMMCCNLGAIPNGESIIYGRGLLYQWGRKDPFPGATGKDINQADPVACTTPWPEFKYFGDVPMKDNNTLAFTIANPRTFIYCDYDPPCENWYCTNLSVMDKKLWDVTKTKYDPCPPGWRVPEIGANSTCVWQQALGIEPGSTTIDLNNWTGSCWDFSNGVEISLSDQEGVVIYPAGGGLSPYYGSFCYYGTGVEGHWWTSTYNQEPRTFSLMSNRANWGSGSAGCCGCSIRCIAE